MRHSGDPGSYGMGNRLCENRKVVDIRSNGESVATVAVFAGQRLQAVTGT